VCVVLLFLVLMGVSFGVEAQASEGRVFRPQVHEEEVLAVEWLSTGEIVLENGERVLLAGVYVPDRSWFRGSGGRALYDRQRDFIRGKLLSKVVRLYTYETVLDRYRLRYGDVYTGHYGEWFQSWLVSKGWGWVLPSPWSYERNRVLLEAETEARRGGYGFWGEGSFKVEDASLWNEGQEGYRMLRGEVGRIDYVGEDVWEMTWRGVPLLQVRFVLGRYMRAPRVGEVVEVRGFVARREGRGYMSLRSHYQLLDGEGRLWFDRHGAGGGG
jgi:endonuclease YncB( thermonuclease family)